MSYTKNIYENSVNLHEMKKSKGGRVKHSEGYIMISQPEHHFHNNMGYVFEHRLVWEQHHNACLLPWADVHHKNEDVTDNKIENLEAMIHGKHITHHNLHKYIPRRDLSERFIIAWRLKWRWLFPKEFYH